jgi:phosphoserine phosphatase
MSPPGGVMWRSGPVPSVGPMGTGVAAGNVVVGAGGALSSWRDGPARNAVIDFVARVCGDRGAEPVPVEQRVAVFDNDGTLWCEKPMPSQLDFILRRLVEMAEADPALRRRQPWQAAYERDVAWLNAVVEAHYAGDDDDLATLAGGILAAYDGITVDEFEERAATFLRTATHPTLARPYVECVYRPMIELLGYLADHGFANYVVSGGGRDFMRPVSAELYGVPRERVIGSTATLAYAADGTGGTITHTAAPDYLDDGPQKPIRIWSRIGRRPLLAGGNSNGDGAMLDFTQHTDRPFLRLVVRHDDADREFAYSAGAEAVLQSSGRDFWTLVSMRDDWATVF